MEEEVRPLTGEELAALPVFPLPRVVFFPGTRLPLHLFEPRYRRMIEDCLAHGPMALAVVLLAPGWERQYEGRPAIHEVAGAGRIIDHERLPNGTHNVILQGVARVSLEEHPVDDRPYRVARATPLADRTPPGGVPASEVTALVGCASAVASAVRAEHPDFDLGLTGDDGPGRVADLIADRLVADLEIRQRALETLDVRERIRLLMGPVSELMATLAPHGRQGRDSFH